MLKTKQSNWQWRRASLVKGGDIISIDGSLGEDLYWRTRQLSHQNHQMNSTHLWIGAMENMKKFFD